MRQEDLYQYDLPIEVLDNIPRTEEVLEVLYARSKEKYLLPMLFTRLRIIWAYPERETVYRIYEMQYIDLLEVHVKYPRTALPGVLTIKNVSGGDYVFRHLKSTPEEMRGGLLTLRDIMTAKVGGKWELKIKQNIISEEYFLKESDDVLSDVDRDDVFEDGPMPGSGCFESTEKLFSHFPETESPGEGGEDGDVFEIAEEGEAPAQDEAMSSAMVTRVSRMIESAEQEAQEPAADEEEGEPVNDVVIIDKDAGVTDFDWDDEITGDAMILPGGKTRVGAAKYKNLEREAREFSPEDDDSVVYESNYGNFSYENTGGIYKSVTLEPKDGLEEDDIDKSLDALKLLRENGIISEKEYKERCLSLFKKNGL